MGWTTSDRVMKVRAKSTPIDVLVETLDGWGRHLSGRNASLLSFFTFLSIFPLMLAATTILGFILEGNEDLQRRIVKSAVTEIPVLGAQLREDPASLDGSVWALLIGLLGAIWSSTKAFVGLQGALDDVWEIDVGERANLAVTRGRAVAGLVLIGSAQVGTIAIAAVVSAADLPGISQLLLILATVVVNIGVLAAMYRFLTSATPTWHEVWPGAIIAGIVFSFLQHFGTRIVEQIQNGASDTYGQFAIVLGLVTWLGLIAIATLMAAELNAALVRRRSNA